jgi:hypothetical protein
MMDQYMNETVGVRLPDGQVVSLRTQVKYTEDDIEVAQRIAKNFSPGTVITVDGNKFKVVSQEPPEVVEVKKPVRAQKASEPPQSERKPIAASATPLEVGQCWVTKDSRRKQEPFKIVQIMEDAILTDKGARIGIHRLNRYKLVS